MTPKPMTQNTDATNFVSNYLLYLLAAASDAASEQFHAAVRAQGIRVPEWRVLACLHDRDGDIVTRLSDFALIEQSRLSKIIVRMEEKGLVRRGHDKEDKRRMRVWLTDQGRSIARDLVTQAKQHETTLLAGLQGKEGAVIKPALLSLLQTLKPDSETK